MNPIRSILVQLDAAPASAARLEFARQLALQRDAALSAMFVGAPPERSLQLAFTESPAALLQSVDRSALKRARSAFDRALADGGAAARWLDSGDPDPAAAFRRQALHADLLVLGQNDPGAAPGASAPAGFVESVLIDTGTPALILPYVGEPAPIAREVLIAWNASAQAAHAVRAALPWLHAARSVNVLEPLTGLAQADDDELDIAQYLRLHGIEPVLHRHRAAPAEAGNALLSFACDVGADLLVMGCYGRGRAREFVLGGASRTVLETMTLPVLMAH